MNLYTEPFFFPGGGLPKTAALLTEKKPITVAYLGGSITQDGHKDVPNLDENMGYRNRISRFFRTRFEHPSVTEIGAGIGGTGGDLGVFRFDYDVLRHNPDLVFVEFVVTDKKLTREQTHMAIEGIVRKGLMHNPNMEFCFIYTMYSGFIEIYGEGTPPDAVVFEQEIAQHYNIPSINVGQVVANKILTGVMQWTDFARDVAHPTAMGHAYYAALACDCLESILDNEQPGLPNLPNPLCDKHLAGAHLEPVSSDDQRPGWEFKPQENLGGWQPFDALLCTSEPGKPLEFEFENDLIGLYYMLHPTYWSFEILY